MPQEHTPTAWLVLVRTDRKFRRRCPWSVQDNLGGFSAFQQPDVAGDCNLIRPSATCSSGNALGEVRRDDAYASR